MTKEFSLDRRAYLKTVGVVGTGLGVAGCSGTGDGGGSDGPTAITAGTAPGFPPFEMKEEGELVGFDIDLLEAVVSEAEGYELDGWKEFEFKSLIPALNSDKIDVVAAGMTITDKRDETIDFTDPYYSSDQAIVVRKGGDFAPSELSDLSGHKVGAQKGTTGESVVKSELIEAGDLKESNYNAYDNYVLAVQDLENGNIDAIVIDQPVGQTFEANRDVSIQFTYETGEKFGFGVRTDADEMTTALNDGLAAVREGGTYEELTSKWFGQ
ncbi:basic amino acid ABC transporter substrate-binding protein [Haloarculaceae archaeon H-GB1-1]|nr:basic amino acid ABC transporter substrate-binding protein [Haloarculaceae archaeon H-GB1-1]